MLRTVALKLVVRNVLDDSVFQSRRIVTTAGDADHIPFPEPSREPREIAVARERIALHVAAPRWPPPQMISRRCVYVCRNRRRKKNKQTRRGQ